MGCSDEVPPMTNKFENKSMVKSVILCITDRSGSDIHHSRVQPTQSIKTIYVFVNSFLLFFLKKW